jgi:hypothetical protein
MKIEYPIEWDVQDKMERPAKGWLSNVKVILENGSEFELTFYDPVRLAQELEEEKKKGKNGIIEKGLMVIPAVTKENIEMAIKQAEVEGYFG